MLCHTFVWTLYIYIGKMLIIHILDISSIIQLNWNLMMSIRALSRHKIAKWADIKSKMATTATIFKINFRHLFPNLWNLLCSNRMTSGYWNKLKLCWLKIQDGHNGSAPLNKMAIRAKNRKSLNDIICLANGLISKYMHRSVPPMALYKIAKMVLLGGTKWQPELKIEKSLKDISSAASVLISK